MSGFAVSYSSSNASTPDNRDPESGQSLFKPPAAATTAASSNPLFAHLAQGSSAAPANPPYDFGSPAPNLMSTPAKPLFDLGGSHPSPLTTSAKPLFAALAPASTRTPAKPLFGGAADSTSSPVKPLFGGLANESSDTPAQPPFGGFALDPSVTPAKPPVGSPGSNPSTTPAGPPPSSARSFTPAGPPPTSMFGSTPAAPIDFDKPAFGSTFLSGKQTSGHLSRQQPQTDSIFGKQTRNGTHSSVMQGGHLASSPPLPGVGSDGDDEDDAMDEDEEDDDDYEQDSEDQESDDDMEEGEEEEEYEEENTEATEPMPPELNDPFRHLASNHGQPPETALQPVRDRGTDSVIHMIARDLASRAGPAHLYEPDDLILGTEHLVSQLVQHQSQPVESHASGASPFARVSSDIVQLWQSSHDYATDDESDGHVIGIGPDERASPIAKSTFLASLLLQLHHPPTIQAANSFSASRASRTFGFSQSFNARAAGRPLPLPKVLLDWLNSRHDPYPSAILDLQNHRPNPANHPNFWDIILSSVLRGKLEEVIRVLKETDFRHAHPSFDDLPKSSAFGRDRSQHSYSEIQVGNIRRVVNRATQVLQQCPAVSVGDWNVRGSDWGVFRSRVSQAIEDLIMFAEGSDREADKALTPFAAENFGIHGMKSNAFAMTEAARRAESKIPWTIYQNLKAMYGMLMGRATEILSFAQDWAEASIGLTAWWDGENQTADPNQSLLLTEKEVKDAHLCRLAWSFARATADADENAFQVNTMNLVEVGLASIFEGDVTGAVGILRSWSLVVASAVVEISHLGQWLGQSTGNAAMAGFDQSDLMVLSYGQSQATKDNVGRDTILIEYAEALFERGTLNGGDVAVDGFVSSTMVGRVEREGWELGVQVLGRLDDAELVSTRMEELLDHLSLDSSTRVDKLLGICQEIDLDKQGRKIAEKHADSLAEGSYNYGEALLYYARAHHERKLKNVLDLLISFCLVQSAAYPPDAELDSHLRRLLSSPQEVLVELAHLDREAADILHSYLSGYATLRKFYDLRDDQVTSGPAAKLHRGARKKLAATALIAVITSAEDSINGGLYDEHRGSVVSVDGLLALLGEVMIFVDQPERVLNLAQCFALLKAIEDLQTVSPRVYAQCEEFLQSTLASAHGSQLSSPRATLKKTISSMTGSSGFSMLGSSMLGSHTQGSLGSSGVLVTSNVKRGWDWRTGLPKNSKGEEVLTILRLGLARELARAWLDEPHTIL